MTEPIARQRREIADEISRLLNRLNELGGRPEEPELILRIVDGSTREHLASAPVDAVTARSLTSDLAAMTDEAQPLAVELPRPVSVPSEPSEELELSQEEAAQVLRQALASSGPDTDRALMMTLRLPDGTFIGDVWQSAQDVEELTIAATALGESHAAFNTQLPPAAAEALPMSAEDIDRGIGQLEQWMRAQGEDGQA